ncbi:N-acetyl sugar amidotransferase [Chryseobacterium tructae]|uniref:N-acetyl sugar amidotransferase n=1 Tax=Chryseobacterium tructae TaxID=1037380 RepID=A0ABV7XT25_9FLAO|nr:N-acetyl sugar amidotransferase [Chryseobacterium tructae]MDN3691670.1 N-acetyl sugar amidotransferase [Chryseobacterium tructae]
MRKYQICTKTIMDTSDSGIIFNEAGESDYYTNFIENILPVWNYGKGRENDLNEIAAKIKKTNSNKDFDCIIGLSGGLDSSYTAYIAKEKMGLRPLLYHVDAGWNTHQAVSNIEKLVNGLNLELYTDVINWGEMKDLQRSFFHAQVPDVDMPQDVAFFSSLYKFARKNNIKYILTGSNYSTECCREPEEWGAYPGIDSVLINDIHAKYGNKKLKSFPIIDILMYKIFYRFILGMKVFHPLNYVEYVKNDAEKLLNEKFDWQPFQHKHHESRFTSFYEDFWLPQKFGYQKRRAHFSSLILTGQMSREEALNRISIPEIDDQSIRNEFDFVAQKLGFEIEEFKNIFNKPNRTLNDFKSKRKLISLGIEMTRFLKLERRLFR